MSSDTNHKTELLRVSLGLVVLIISAFLIDSAWYGWRTRADAESMGFAQLSAAAKEMINQHARGVMMGANGQYISSFQSFLDFVQKTRPTWTEGSTVSNPFPGVLPRGIYTTLKLTARTGDDVLISGTRTYKWSTGTKYKIVLTCDGEASKPAANGSPTMTSKQD